MGKFSIKIPVIEIIFHHRAEGFKLCPALRPSVRGVYIVPLPQDEGKGVFKSTAKITVRNQRGKDFILRDQFCMHEISLIVAFIF